MKIYEKNSMITKIGELGDTFYIILAGKAGVLQPTTHINTYETYFELFQFMLKNFKFL
jgi:hypothetical protein